MLSALIPVTPHSIDFDGILAVGQANAKGSAPLPGTVTELAAVRAQSHQQNLRFTQLDGTNATSTAVLDAMKTHSWIHLACHATQNVRTPTSSAFILHDGPLNLSTIIQNSLTNKGLAFLSACQTATGDTGLPDEAVHLAAGMLMAGYPSVIGTMWSIKDQDAPKVAEHMYKVLFKGGAPDWRGSAGALHRAASRLRAELGEKAFARWVPYIHIGA
jgi:CHAT domain-containing protein